MFRKVFITKAGQPSCSLTLCFPSELVNDMQREAELGREHGRMEQPEFFFAGGQ